MNLAAAFDYYSALGRRKGWGAYVIHEARTLAADHPVLYADLPKMLAADNPAITQERVAMAPESRATTYRLEASRFTARPTKGAR